MDSHLIYDVGGHLGEDTDFYLRKGFKVIAIEANPVLTEKLKERFQSNLSDGSLVLIDAAIAENTGEVDFYVDQAFSIWGTIRPVWAERNAAFGISSSELIKVKATNFSEILGKHGVPYYLKIDIEGADLLCLKSLAEEQDKPKFVSIESEKRSWPALLNEFEMFKKLGYSRFKIVDQKNIDRQKPPAPAAEGCYVQHSFEPGSSGLFGEELPGKWLTMSQAIRRYRLIFLGYRIFGDAGILRVLLKIPGFRKALPRSSEPHTGESSNTPAGKNALRSALRQLREKLRAPWYDTHATS
ncbi:MAG TPA: FkbM family methyltransferase [Edaphobacter sp.]|nr:FkbM family methyltransferase [Edaphobacter sp.]